MAALLHKVAELISPLSDFYESAGAVLPHIEAVAPHDVPEPYHHLLVHSNDMTPTLEAHWDKKIYLRPLAKLVDDGELFRQVVLVAGEEQQPVEFGAICIHLDMFTEEQREVILEAHVPLGSILHEYSISHSSKPSGYFSIESDAISRQAFGLKADCKLYGRHNVLSTDTGGVLAEVVEILPPMED